MFFDWDENKNLINRTKHNVRFENAAAVFDDPLFVSRMEREVEGEERWQTIGMVDGVLLVVAHTLEDDEDGNEMVRIISARKAERHERRRYEQTL